MRYYPDYEDASVGQHAKRSTWHDGQPEEGSRYTEKVYSIKNGEQKLVREKIWEYQFGKRKDGTKKKKGHYVLIETIEH